VPDDPEPAAMRILLAEDNRELSSWLARLLRKDNYVIDCVYDGEEADEALATQDYALVILDLGLPRIDGIEILRRFRARNTTTPVLILTANDAVSSRVQGLDSGADDYLVKPFAINELEARIRAQLRRSHNNKATQVVHGPLLLDTTSREFQLAGSALALTRREHAVLEALLMRAGRPVAKSALAANVFGFNDDANPNAIEIYVHRVRKKLEGHGISIGTLRGLGYMLKVDDGS
jgi:two-component system, OmpR family, response regulator TctD